MSEGPSRDEPSGGFDPFVTVVVRSFNQIDALRELVHRLLAQRGVSFEVLIVDASRGMSARAVYESVATSDPRVRVVHTPSRGSAAAANEGVRRARGEIVVFLRDRDTPVGDDWLETHVRRYRDPRCLGVNGFIPFAPTRTIEPPWLAKRAAPLSHGLFKQPRIGRNEEGPRPGLDFLLDTNASLRTSVAMRAGGWDEGLELHHEQSLFLRLASRMKPGEHLLYEPAAKVTGPARDEGPAQDDASALDAAAKHFLWIVARECPSRIYGLFPVFVPAFAWEVAREAAARAVGSGASPGAAAAQAALRAPASLAKHLLAPRPNPRKSWIDAVPGEQAPWDTAGSAFTEALA
jgi:hypothetical protein